VSTRRLLPTFRAQHGRLRHEFIVLAFAALLLMSDPGLVGRFLHFGYDNMIHMIQQSHNGNPVKGILPLPGSGGTTTGSGGGAASSGPPASISSAPDSVRSSHAGFTKPRHGTGARRIVRVVHYGASK
jgi:hypothetical protein